LVVCISIEGIEESQHKDTKKHKDTKEIGCEPRAVGWFTCELKELPINEIMKKMKEMNSATSRELWLLAARFTRGQSLVGR